MRKLLCRIGRHDWFITKSFFPNHHRKFLWMFRLSTYYEEVCSHCGAYRSNIDVGKELDREALDAKAERKQRVQDHLNKRHIAALGLDDTDY